MWYSEDMFLAASHFVVQNFGIHSLTVKIAPPIPCDQVGTGTTFARKGTASSGSTAVTLAAGGAGVVAVGQSVFDYFEFNHNTASLTAKGATAVTLASGTHVAVGQPVSGPGVPKGTTVATGSSGTSLVLSAATTKIIKAGTKLAFEGSALAASTTVQVGLRPPSTAHFIFTFRRNLSDIQRQFAVAELKINV